MIEPRFFRYYNMLLQENADGCNWLDQIPRELWTLAWDDGKRWGHMTTNLAEAINSVFKKSRNLPISSLVRATHERINKYFIKRGTEADAMLSSGQIYTPNVATYLSEEQVKANAHFVQQFDRQRAEFLVDERVHPREKRRPGRFKVRLDLQTCDCGKLQKLHMLCAHVIAACKHVNLDYTQFIHPVYTLQNVSNAYKGSLAGMRHEQYWPTYDGPLVCHNPKMRRNKKGRPKSTRIRTTMDDRERGLPKRCSICRTQGHSKKNCPHRPGTSNQ